jgi:hypothetical protein
MKRPKFLNSGTINYNDKKTKAGHPDMKGVLDVEGKLFWFSGWWKDGKSGEFLSSSITQVSRDEMDKYFADQEIPTERLGGGKKEEAVDNKSRRKAPSNDTFEDGKGNSDFDDDPYSGDDDLPF